jgi:hypothetical protein
MNIKLLNSRKTRKDISLFSPARTDAVVELLATSSKSSEERPQESAALHVLSPSKMTRIKAPFGFAWAFSSRKSVGTIFLEHINRQTDHTASIPSGPGTFEKIGMPAAGAILAITWGLPIASVLWGILMLPSLIAARRSSGLKTLIKQVPGGRLMYLKTTLIHSIATPIVYRTNLTARALWNIYRRSRWYLDGAAEGEFIQQMTEGLDDVERLNKQGDIYIETEVAWESSRQTLINNLGPDLEYKKHVSDPQRGQFAIWMYFPSVSFFDTTRINLNERIVSELNRRISNDPRQDGSEDSKRIIREDLADQVVYDVMKAVKEEVFELLLTEEAIQDKKKLINTGA